MNEQDRTQRMREATRSTRASAERSQWGHAAEGAILGGSIFVIARTLGVWDLINDPMLPMLALCVVASAAWACTRWRRWLWIKTGVLLACLVVVLATPVAPALQGRFVRTDPVSAVTPDAIVILSGSLSDDGHVNRDALDRLISGLTLSASRQIPHVALSVISEEAGGQRATSEQDQRALVALMAPHATITFIRDVFSTRDEALGFAAVAKANGWRRVVLVTSPMHSARACATFERVGLPVECVPASSRSFSLTVTGGAGNRLLAFRSVLYEAFATVTYRGRG